MALVLITHDLCVVVVIAQCVVVAIAQCVLVIAAVRSTSAARKWCRCSKTQAAGTACAGLRWREL